MNPQFTSPLESAGAPHPHWSLAAALALLALFLGVWLTDEPKPAAPLPDGYAYLPLGE